jgi:hypothetical protein
LPYKDLVTRRDFQRRYKRKVRAAQAKTHPFKGVKIYLCLWLPNLRMPGASFRDGFLITSDPEIQARVERHPRFGTFIFPLALDLDLTTPVVDEEE